MADDNIVIEYEAKIAQAEAALTRLEGDLKKVGKAQSDVNAETKKSVGIVNDLKNSTQKLTAARDSATDPKKVKELNKQIDVQNKKMKELTTTTETLGSKFGNLASQLPFIAQIKQVKDLAGAVIGVGSAAKTSAGAFQFLKAAIISTGIGAIIVGIVTAVTALITYLKRTDEGADRLAKGMAILGAVMDVVTGVIIGIGEGVFNAFRSLENFKAGLLSVGELIGNFFLNRAKGLLMIFQAIGTIIDATFEKIKGNSVEAAKLYAQGTEQMLDATAQFVTGVEGARQKIGEFADKIAKAAEEAKLWQDRMNKLEDKIRENSVVIAENEKAITKLLVQAKNKQISDEESLKLLEDASKLEKENLAIALSSERQKLALIREKNQRESDSINQDIKNGETRRSINDNLAQEEVDQRIKIINLEKESANLQEKIENRKDAKREEIFQNQLKRLGQEEISNENFAKALFIHGTTNAEELEKELLKIKMQGLKNQRALLIENGRDIAEIDKAILDLEVGMLLKTQKEKEAIKKAENDNFLKMVKERLDAEDKLSDENRKKQEEEEKAHQAKIRAIVAESAGILGELVSGLAANKAEARQMELDEELRKSQEETDTKTALLQKQLDQGIISQEQFDARKAAIDKKQDAKESEIKKKQFEADKKAKLSQIAIDTAVAVVKTFASLGYPAGIPASLLAIAAGLAQAAVVQSTPTPKFKDGVIDLQGKGTATSDSIHAMLSKGESVMTARETQEHMPILQAIRDNSLNDYIKDSYILPALQSIEVSNSRARAERENVKDRKLNAILNNMNLDTSNLERATKNNSNVGIKNTKQLAKDMVREMQINSNWYK